MAESIVKNYYDGLAEGKIYAHKCNVCGKYTFPPTTMCEYCASDDYEQVEFSGKGKLEYVSHGRSPSPNPRFVEIAPYAYGHVCLEEGVYVHAIITNIDYSAKTMQSYFEKGPVDVVADIATYIDDLHVLAFKVV